MVYTRTSARVAALRALRAVGGMETAQTAHLHAPAASPLHQLHLLVRWRYECRMAAEPVAGAKSVSIEQNISDDLLDGEAEPHYLTGDAGDRAGCL
eukprot:7211088-Prymnesium_polylepis.1